MIVCSALVFNACGKETATIDSPAIAEYASVTVGKYITYRLDSTVFTNFGLTEETKRYQVKDVVDAQITDNLGRPSFRIIRYLRDSLGTQPWAPNATFLVTPLGDQLEFVENNLRYIKLHLPIQDGFTWKGNTHIDTYSAGSEVKYLDDWDYNYEQFGQSYTVRGVTVPNTVKISQRDETIPNGPFNPNGYYERNFSSEVYAKGIGLIYRNFIHWEYQPPRVPGQQGDRKGYGVKLEMIDRN